MGRTRRNAGEIFLYRRHRWASADRIHHSPSSSKATHLEPLHLGRQARVDREAVTTRFEPQHRAKEQERSSAGPRLRAAGSGVLHRKLRAFPRVAGERLGEAILE